MNQTIKIDQLADTVMKGMEDYAKLVVDDLKADVQKAGKTVKQQIESTAPKKTGKYSKSWMIKKTRETSDSIQIVVHSKRYQLTHLLEFGHAKRGGGRTRAFAYRSCGTGGYRAADKGYREGFTEGRLVMMKFLFLLFVITIGISVFGALLYYGTRRGEKCRGHPYNCLVCRHAAECNIEIGRKKDDA